MTGNPGPTKTPGRRLGPIFVLAVVVSSAPLPSSSQTAAAGRVAAGVVPEPIAVMPFRNINENPDLEWLSAGMSETMLSDLRREGKTIVMRDALNTAIAEMALQGIRPTDESTAARVGQLVGAKTMVFGGYQTAAGQIRITARFVEVETSLVLDAAMATGPITNVLSLQDEIVAKILGRPPAPPARTSAALPRAPRPSQPGATKSPRPESPPDRKQEAGSGPADSATDSGVPPGPARPSGENVVEAYRYYSMSLTTSSDAERIALLQRSVEIDDGFVYAIDELRALEQRLQTYRQRRLEALAHRADQGLQAVFDESLSAQERATLANQIMGDHMTARRYRTLADVARRIYDLNLPPGMMGNPTEAASFYLFTAYKLLGEPNLALQIGERHLQEFPGGMYTQSVEINMPVIIQQEEAARQRRAEAEEKLLELPERQRNLDSIARPDAREIQARMIAFDRCRLLQQADRHGEAHAACDDFIRVHGDGQPGLLSAAVLFKLNTFAAERRFTDGRAWAQELIAGDPPDDVRNIIRSTVTWWAEE